MSEVSTKLWLKPPGMICTVIDNNPKLYFGLFKKLLDKQMQIE